MSEEKKRKKAPKEVKKEPDMIAVIRIKGQVGLRVGIKETFKRLRLARKFWCVVLENPSKEQIGMVEKIRDFVAFGEISKETLNKLNEKRKSSIKNLFRLHPPRGGIDSKKHAGVQKGVLGDNKEKINDLIEKML